MVKICYIDEAGCTGCIESSTSNIQPTLSIIGAIVDYGKLHKLTSDLLDLKKRFFPKLLPATATHLDWIQAEVKGSEIRKQVCQTGRNQRRAAIGVLDNLQTLCDQADLKLVGRIWIKGIGKPVNGTSIYTYSIQSIYHDFQRYLEETNDIGFVVADSRVQHLNTQVAHSVFTQKFKGTGDNYDRVIELPAFSHSDNHAGLQVTDLLVSAVTTPIAINTYCAGAITSTHVRPNYHLIKDRYKSWLQKIQFRYDEASGRTRGGLVISDSLSKKSGGELFR
ncbi:MAG: DUF3800 domain-containing protein [Rhodobacteraceae bacterium]|nr:DUF3800 domain-containing protein [Paracoccaceae bacterium]